MSRTLHNMGKKMRVVVTGGTGFVGHHLLPELSSRGHECLVLCRNAARSRELSLIPGVEIRPADIHDVESLGTQLRDADALINLVGILNESGRNGMGFWNVHVSLVEKLIEACQASGVRRFLQVSALNAGKGKSYYLSSKGRAEELIRESANLDATIVQPSVIFGDGDAFFNRFASLMKWMPVMPLACPESRMQPVWVGDLVAAMGAMLDDPQSHGKTYVVVGPNSYSLRELVQFTAKTIGRKRMVLGLPDGISRLQGALMDFVPGKPFSSDNYKSLQIDNTSVENALWSYGIRPRSLESVVGAYLSGSVHQHHLDSFRERAGREDESG
jgi:NADH dehydrogenase